jgi:hypothetical protein
MRGLHGMESGCELFHHECESVRLWFCDEVSICQCVCVENGGCWDTSVVSSMVDLTLLLFVVVFNICYWSCYCYCYNIIVVVVVVIVIVVVVVVIVIVVVVVVVCCCIQ